KFKSLKIKLIAFFVINLVFVICAIVGYGIFSSLDKEKFVKSSSEAFANSAAKDLLIEKSRAISFEIKSELETALDSVRTLAEVFSGIKDQRIGLEIDRQRMNNILKMNLNKNKTFLGVYTVWEPNALDQSDALNAGTKGHDQTGRFIPYWSRDTNGKVQLDPLMDYESHEQHENGVRKGDYYLLPRERKMECVIDPYPYPVQNKIVWLTSLVVPIMVDNTFYGMAGVDFRLDFIMSLAEQANNNFYKGAGSIAIVSHNGILAAVSGKPELVGKHLQTWIPETWKENLELVRMGKETVILDKGKLKVVVPLNIGKTGMPWAVMADIPEQAVMAEVNKLVMELKKKGKKDLTFQAVFALIVTLAALLFVWFMSGRIVKPIIESIQFARSIAQGDIGANLESGHTDEVGILVNALNEMKLRITDVLKETDGLIQGIAQGNLGTRGNADNFEGGWQDLIEGVNKIIDAFVAPINMTADSIERIAKGDIPGNIKDEFQGDFNHIKNNLNGLINAMNETTHIAEEIAAGNLSVDAKERSSNDRLMQALNSMIKGLNEIIGETEELIQNTREGKLDVRGNAKDFSGTWNKMVMGINSLIDAFTEPIYLTAEYIDRISKGDIPEKITDKVKGDFNEIKNNINTLITNLLGTVQVAEKVAAGDLSLKVKVLSENDRLGKSINKMTDNLNRFAMEVQNSAQQVASGSGQLSSSAEQVSEGTSQQAASIEQISSSMEEMSSMVSQNADNARETAGIAMKAAKETHEGRNAVSETVQAMKSISGKIHIIEDIARQTNMLALNAAIEAARAGTHGKGFAVVATEVRQLAEKSQKAANDINILSVSNLEIAEKAGLILENMVSGIQKTSELVQEISASSGEQSDGISQVNKAIQQLDQVIQENAAATEEMASTSQDFSGQAGRLLKSASFFKVSREDMEKMFMDSQTQTANFMPNQEAPTSALVPQKNTPNKISIKDEIDDNDFEVY
ncbi:methyl-accepting chemotaxis protein, partial [Desulfobacterales bacterium HSG17]|nr:methyl-accepting chemotaxis protein [Desulfobacterales bacterium HSG17]